MSDDLDLTCKIHVDTALSAEAVIKKLQSTLGGTINHYEINTTSNDVEIVENDEFDIVRCQEFPDGFLYFRYYLEISPTNLSLSLDEQRQFIVTVLDHFWSDSIPAIAVCDYEDKLPHNGGYKSKDVPWPNGFKV